MHRPHIFYGWLVVAACFAITCTLGESMWSFGVFFKPLELEFGWNRQMVSSAYTAFLLGFAVSLIVSGRLVDRYPPRLVLLGSALLAGVGIALCSQANDIWQLRMFLLIAGLGAGSTWAVPSSMVQKWFAGHRHSGIALAIVTTGVGVGAIVFAPLINHLIESYGWRTTFVAVGVTFALIITMSAFIIRQAPVLSDTSSKSENTNNPRNIGPVWTTRQAMKTSAFISITIALCFAMLSWQVIAVHLIPHATDQNISAGAAALALGMIGGISIPGRLFSGYMSEKAGWHKVLVLSYAGMGLSVLLLLLTTTNTATLYVFVVVYGFFHGLRIPAQVAILNTYFGLKSLGELIGISTAAAQLTAAFAPYAAGYIFDTSGSYFTVFAIIASLFIVSAMVLARIQKPAPIY